MYLFFTKDNALACPCFWKWTNFILFDGWVMLIVYLLYSIICWWTLVLFQYLSYFNDDMNTGVYMSFWMLCFLFYSRRIPRNRMVMQYMAFIVLGCIPSILTLLRVSIISGCYISSNAFYVSFGMITWFVSFTLSCITLQLLNYSDIHGINPTWLWYMILSIYWVWFINFIEDFYIYFHQDCWPVIPMPHGGVFVRDKLTLVS